MKQILLLLSLLLITSCSSTKEPKNKAELGYKGKNHKAFGYDSVEDLLTSLKSDTNNIVNTVNGDFGLWTIVQNKKDRTIWSFTPKRHPAHPSVVKRSLVEKDGYVNLNTEASCSAEKSICDALIKSFSQLNS